MPYFAAKGYDCHALSLRGHGESEGRERLDWCTLDDYVSDVVEVVDRFESPPLLIGHSMGGMIVQKTLEKRKAAGAIFLASLPPFGLAVSALHMATVAPGLLWQIQLLQMLGEEWVSPTSVYHHLFSEEMSAELLEKYLPRLQKESKVVSMNLLWPQYPRLRRDQFPPALVIGGTKDAFIPAWAVRETAALYGADVEILKGVAHVMMIDEGSWRQVADKMCEWLETKGF